MKRVLLLVLLFACTLTGNARILQPSGDVSPSGQDYSGGDCAGVPCLNGRAEERYLDVDSLEYGSVALDVVAQTQDSLKKRMSVVDYTFKPVSLILPASLIAVGAVGTAIDGMNDFHLFSRKDSVKQIKVDNYLEWGMLGWVFVCDLIGKEKHNWVDQLFLVGLGEVINAGLVHGVKNIVNERRPDGTPYSFPSGHTSNVFLGAHIAYKEFKDSNSWLAYSGYAVGVLVGASRLYNNRHWVADVVAGAGFGILSAELSYLIYFPIRNAIAKKINLRSDKKLLVSPVVRQDGAGIYLSYQF